MRQNLDQLVNNESYVALPIYGWRESVASAFWIWKEDLISGANYLKSIQKRKRHRQITSVCNK